MLKNAVELSHFYLKNTIKPGAFCVDATCGNGGDTAYLASLVGEHGRVLGFDIQETAIQNTRLLLEENGLSDRVQLILDSHENMAKYLGKTPVDAFVFNLGYLPKGDHTIHTRGETTVRALDTALSYLKQDGILLVAIYHGKDSGFLERDIVLKHLKTLNFHCYNVVIHEYSNKPNFPPILALVCHNLTHPDKNLSKRAGE